MRPRIFLSAVTAQFAACRDKVAAFLRSAGAEVQVQEDFRQGPKTLLEKLQSCIDQCDAVVFLVGTAYGAQPMPAELPPGDWQRSYTQWEYYLAQGERLNGSRAAPKRLFVYFADAAFLQAHPVSQTSAETQRQRAFCQEILASGKDRTPFATLDALVACVLRDVVPLWSETAGGWSSVEALRQHLRRHAAAMLAGRRLRRLAACDIELDARCNGRQIPLADAWREHPRLILAGAPGSGKSIFLLQKFQQTCQLLQSGLERVPPAIPVPVPVLAELGQLQNPRDIKPLLLSSLGAPPEVNASTALKDLLNQSALTLLLDGINEMPLGYREACAKELIGLDQELQALAGAEPVRITLSTRPYGFFLRDLLEDAGFVYAEIMPVPPEEIQRRLAARFGDDVFRTIGPKVRHLLSNPQHLAYAMEWLAHQASMPDASRQTLHSRGALLQAVTRRRLQRLPPNGPAASVAPRVLQQLAYEARDGSVHFARRVVVDALAAELAQQRFDDAPTGVLEQLQDAGLLEQTEGPPDQGQFFRYTHHSVQQFFAACRMKERRKQRGAIAGYTGNVLWHEPLVIMAGLLEDRDLNALLQEIRRQPELYAYVLANVDRPALERELLQRTTRRFLRRVGRWAWGLNLQLAGLFAVWYFSLPVLACVIAAYGRSLQNPLLPLAAAAYLAAVPAGLIRWGQQRFRHAVEQLRSRHLPELIAVLRYFDAAATLKQLREDLDGMLSRVCGPSLTRPFRLASSAGQEDNIRVLARALLLDYERQRQMERRREDQRVAFVQDALQAIEQAINARPYLTEDELLEQAEPMALGLLAPELLGRSHVEGLCRLTQPGARRDRFDAALAKLREVYARNPDHRPRLAAQFRELATDPRQGGRRRAARRVCRELAIAVDEDPGTQPGRVGRWLWLAAAALLAAGGLWLWAALRGK